MENSVFADYVYCCHGTILSAYVHELLWVTYLGRRRKWKPTPVLLPGKSQGWKSLIGCRLWCHTESDTAEAT